MIAVKACQCERNHDSKSEQDAYADLDHEFVRSVSDALVDGSDENLDSNAILGKDLADNIEYC